MASSPFTSLQIEGEKVETVTDFLFLGSKITADGDCSYEIRRWLLLHRRAMANLDSMLKREDITWPTKVQYSQSYGFSGSHVQLWELDCEEGWVLKNLCFLIVELEKTLESPWTARLNQSILKEINLEYSLRGLMLKLKASVLWPHDAKSWLIGKDPDSGKDWRQKEKRAAED